MQQDLSFSMRSRARSAKLEVGWQRGPLVWPFNFANISFSESEREASTTLLGLGRDFSQPLSCSRPSLCAKLTVNMPWSRRVISAPVQSHVSVHPEGAGTLPPKNIQDHALDSPSCLCCLKSHLCSRVQECLSVLFWKAQVCELDWNRTRRVETKVGDMGSHTRQPAWCLFPFQCTGAECRIWVCYAMFYCWAPAPAGLASMAHKIYLTKHFLSPKI